MALHLLLEKYLVRVNEPASLVKHFCEDKGTVELTFQLGPRSCFSIRFTTERFKRLLGSLEVFLGFVAEPLELGSAMISRRILS